MQRDIKTAFERQTKAVTLKPSVGQNTAVTKIKLRDGSVCDIEEGNWKYTADLSPKWGGKDEGPSAGFYGRGALGSCLAISYVMWAARYDIPVEELTVEIHADYDTRGMCGLDNISSGYSEIRYVVNIKSPVSEEEIIKLLDTAESHSPYLEIFRNPQRVVRVLNFNNIKED